MDRTKLRKRPRIGGFEALEERSLLSTLSPGTSVAPSVPIMGPATTTSAATTTAASPDGVDKSVAAKGEFAVKTVAKGYTLTHSNDVAHVGVNYAKLAVAPNTAKVGLAYAGAALKGDTKRLDQLGHTRLVKNVGRQFTALSHSDLIRKVGDRFSSFGQSVRDGFNRLFY